MARLDGFEFIRVYPQGLFIRINPVVLPSSLARSIVKIRARSLLGLVRWASVLRIHAVRGIKAHVVLLIC